MARVLIVANDLLFFYVWLCFPVEFVEIFKQPKSHVIQILLESMLDSSEVQLNVQVLVTCSVLTVQ